MKSILVLALFSMSILACEPAVVQRGVPENSVSSYKEFRLNENSKCLARATEIFGRAKAGEVTEADFGAFYSQVRSCYEASFAASLYSEITLVPLDYLHPTAVVSADEGLIKSVKLWLIHELITYSDPLDSTIIRQGWSTWRNVKVDMATDFQTATQIHSSAAPVNWGVESPMEQVKISGPSVSVQLRNAPGPIGQVTLTPTSSNTFSTKWLADIEIGTLTAERSVNVQAIRASQTTVQSSCAAIEGSKNYNDTARYEDIVEALIKIQETLPKL